MSAQVYYDNPAEACVVVPVTFESAGVAADPTSVSCVVTDPTGTATTYTYGGAAPDNLVTRTSLGNYALTLTGITLAGLYTAVWVGTGGTVQQVTPTTFRVVPLSAVGTGMNLWYTGKEELKSRLNIVDDNSDYEIQLAIQAVTNWINTYCVVPETPVLTAGLRYVPAGELLPGDELVGFDEYPVGPSHPKRHFRRSVVTAAPRRKASCIRVTLADGREVTTASEHLWLTRTGHGKNGTVYQWVSAADMRAGYEIASPVRTWDDGTTFELPLAHEIWEAGHISRQDGNSSVRVTAVEDAGIREVVSLSTSTGTYIANGLASHNCGRHFYQVTETRTYMPDNIWELPVDDIVSTPSVVSNCDVKLDYDGDGIYETDWGNPAPPLGTGKNYTLKLGTPSNYQDNYNVNAAGVPRPYTQLQALMGAEGSNAVGGGWLPFVWPYTILNRVQITTTWGWPVIPPSVAQASLLLCTDVFKSKDAPWGIAGTAETGLMRVSTNPWAVEFLHDYVNTRRKVGV